MLIGVLDMLAQNLLRQLAKSDIMTCRYAHKRVAQLFIAAQPTVAAGRVIDWPQKMNSTSEQRPRVSVSVKSQPENSYASK